MDVAWNYALCCISLAFYSASDECGLELCTMLHQPGLLLSTRWVWPGTICTMLHQPGLLLSIRMGVDWSYVLCYISLAFYSALDGLGLELFTFLYQPGLLLSIRRVWYGTMHSVASAWPSTNI
jgi:hypothetical protein